MGPTVDFLCFSFFCIGREMAGAVWLRVGHDPAGPRPSATGEISWDKTADNTVIIISKRGSLTGESIQLRKSLELAPPRRQFWIKRKKKRTNERTRKITGPREREREKEGQKDRKKEKEMRKEIRIELPKWPIRVWSILLPPIRKQPRMNHRLKQKGIICCRKSWFGATYNCVINSLVISVALRFYSVWNDQLDLDSDESPCRNKTKHDRSFLIHYRALMMLTRNPPPPGRTQKKKMRKKSKKPRK